MPLTPGDRLGPYEILSPLGAGGMGEVYRARDPKLNRDVAIKVLPPALANDADYLARFQREAQALAALNHPNIAAIYGLEGNAIVMELVEGETLKGPLAVKEALPIARQIAEALEAAHDKGIIHRDLKPGNIKLTPEGVVKVLDFGLAKSVERNTATGPDSPTLTMRATEAGLILGTAGYMSPEQAAGKAVDRRADIWSFGVVLYELLTGKRLFDGETVSHTLAHVLTAEVDLSKIPAGPIRELIRRCLDRNLKNRLSHIAEARYIIDHYGTQPSVPAVKTKAKYWPWAITAATGLALLAVSFAYFRQSAPELPVRITSINPPEKATFQETAFSPDGKLLAFTAFSEGKRQLWVRSLDAATAQPLAGTDQANQLFWSPDSRWIGFFSRGKLYKIQATGGPVQAICDALSPRGATWSAEGVLLFGELASGLYRVPAQGGTPAAVTTLDRTRDERDHRWPVFLPGGRRYLYQITGSDPKTTGIYLGALDTAERMRLVGDANSPGYAMGPTGEGYLLFVRQGTLLAQRLDAERGALTGEAFPVADKVGTDERFSRARYSVAGTGLLTYASGGRDGKQLKWMDRVGAVLETVGEPVEGVLGLALSPDEKQVAFGSVSGANPDLWVRDLARGLATRFTFHPAAESNPIWSPDGSRMVFWSNREGSRHLYTKSTRGAGREELLLKTQNYKVPTSWSSDGRLLLYHELASKTKVDLWVLQMEGERKPVMFLRTEFNEHDGAFSPDGKWIAYVSDESGRYEVYVQPYPATGAKWQVSKDGGTRPRWRRDGKELFWLTEGGTLLAADVTAGPAFQSATPRRLFETRIAEPLGRYEVSGDGKRFLIPLPVETDTNRPLTLIENWLAAAKR